MFTSGVPTLQQQLSLHILLMQQFHLINVNVSYAQQQVEMKSFSQNSKKLKEFGHPLWSHSCQMVPN